MVEEEDQEEKLTCKYCDKEFEHIDKLKNHQIEEHNDKVCYLCGEEFENMPFKCKYCGKKFCSDHRLPESHNCTYETGEKKKEKWFEGEEKETKEKPEERGWLRVTKRPGKLSKVKNKLRRVSWWKVAGAVFLISVIVSMWKPNLIRKNTPGVIYSPVNESLSLLSGFKRSSLSFLSSIFEEKPKYHCWVKNETCLESIKELKRNCTDSIIIEERSEETRKIELSKFEKTCKVEYTITRSSIPSFEGEYMNCEVPLERTNLILKGIIKSSTLLITEYNMKLLKYCDGSLKDHIFENQKKFAKA